jgi:hypothetical protein
MSALAITSDELSSLPLPLALTAPQPGNVHWDDDSDLAALSAGRYYDSATQVNIVPSDLLIEMRSTKCSGICGTGFISDRDQVSDD